MIFPVFPFEYLKPEMLNRMEPIYNWTGTNNKEPRINPQIIFYTKSGIFRRFPSNLKITLQTSSKLLRQLIKGKFQLFWQYSFETAMHTSESSYKLCRLPLLFFLFPFNSRCFSICLWNRYNIRVCEWESGEPRSIIPEKRTGLQTIFPFFLSEISIG